MKLISLPAANKRTAGQATIAVNTRGTVGKDSKDQVNIHVQWDCHPTCHVVFPAANVRKV